VRTRHSRVCAGFPICDERFADPVGAPALERVEPLRFAVFRVLPIYANDVLKGGARILDCLSEFRRVGAVLGALQFAARTHYKGLARWIAATSMTCAVALIVFSAARRFLLCAGVLFVVGFCRDVTDGGDKVSR